MIGRSFGPRERTYGRRYIRPTDLRSPSFSTKMSWMIQLDYRMNDKSRDRLALRRTDCVRARIGGSVRTENVVRFPIDGRFVRSISSSVFRSRRPSVRAWRADRSCSHAPTVTDRPHNRPTTDNIRINDVNFRCTYWNIHALRRESFDSSFGGAWFVLRGVPTQAERAWRVRPMRASKRRSPAGI